MERRRHQHPVTSRFAQVNQILATSPTTACKKPSAGKLPAQGAHKSRIHAAARSDSSQIENHQRLYAGPGSPEGHRGCVLRLLSSGRKRHRPPVTQVEA